MAVKGIHNPQFRRHMTIAQGLLIDPGASWREITRRWKCAGHNVLRAAHYQARSTLENLDAGRAAGFL